MSLLDMDNVTIGFILDLVEENNKEASTSYEIEADTDIINNFFR